ncbi:MAG: hypothetical protein HY303_12315 [Candidatus Wallbacteria bacterium]|nr:hypothetical protein [Candidatus Wallbacteria bacterium]
MEKTILRFGASLLLTAAASTFALAQDATPAAGKDASAPAAAAAPAAEASAQANAPAKEEASKGKKKHRKHKKHGKHKGQHAQSRQSDLSAAMAREVEKRKGNNPYGHEERARDLDRDIENMQKALDSSKDEAHKARLSSMLEHLKALRSLHGK